MEIQTDQGLLVVSLENCIANAALQQIAKGDCIYHLAVSNVDDSSTMLQIPVTLQCNGNLQHSYSSQLQQQSQNASQQYTQQQFDQVQIAEQLQCLLETNAQMSQLKTQDILPTSLNKSQAGSSNQSDLETAVLCEEPVIELELGYNEIYNYLDTKTFCGAASDSYKKRLIKKAKLYSIIDGTLYHGLKKLRKVVTNTEDQLEILHNFHVQSDSGVHLGVRKMHSAILSSFFWEGVYVDVTNFVRHCKGCSEAAEHSTYVETSSSTYDENATPSYVETTTPSYDNATPSLPANPWSHPQSSEPINETTATPLCNQTSSPVWRKVEAQVYGPFNKTARQNEYLLTLSDPESHWITTLPVPNNDIVTRMASFIFETFCVFGFAKCNVVTSLPKHFKLIDGVYEDRLRQMPDVACKLSRVGVGECLWVGQLVESVTAASSTDWDREQDKLMFKYRTTADESGRSPFARMFQRGFNESAGEEKENDDENYEDVAPVEGSTKRRRLQSSILQCRHCDDVFTSKISFRIHQRKHTEDARHRGQLEGQQPMKVVGDRGRKTGISAAVKKQALLRRRGTASRVDRLKAKMIQNSTLRPTQHYHLPRDGQHAELKANTLAAVKQVLASTKDARRRRGKYKKYTSELHDEMARYAMEHGNLAAVSHFTDKLGCTVSESTVRNIVKLHRSFTPEIKEEIGRYAAAFGIEAASTYYSQHLEREVRQGLVRKFKKLYVRKFPDVLSKHNTNVKDVTNSAAQNTTKQKLTFSTELREEIGCYACQFSISETVDHYAQKSQLSLNKNTVRKFRKMYTEKYQKAEPVEMDAQPQMLATNNIQENVGSSTSQTIDILNASLNLLNNPQMNNSSTIIYNHLYQSGNGQSTGHLIPLGQAGTPMRFHTIAPNYGNIPTTMSISYLPQQQQQQQQHQHQHNSVVTNQNSNTFNQNVSSSSTFQQSQNDFLSFSQHQLPSVQNNTLLLPQHSSTSHQQVFATSGSVLSPLMPSTSRVATAVSQTQHQYISGNQSLLLPNQQLIQIQLDKQSGQSNKLMLNNNSTKTNPIHLQSQNEHLPIIEFEQVLQNTASEMPYGTVPTIIADRDGTYTISTTISADSPLTVLEENPGIIIQSASSPAETVVVSVMSKETQEVPQKKLATQSSKRKSSKPAVAKVDRVALVSDTEEDVDDPDSANDLQEGDSDFVVNPSRKRGKRKKSTKKKSPSKKQNVSKRGSYTTYSPEIRAKMGKYAAEHGSLNACQHFRSLLGHDVPESTVRGLRDRYLLKREQLGTKVDKEVTSLGYSTRGRPMRLGKYDQVVQECIWELVRTGEKVSSFLAVTTAKQVLMQYEPSLLEENGGHIKLNVTWAKSFLKRIGVHSNT